MITRKSSALFLFASLFIFLGLNQCNDRLADEITYDLPEIKERGTLIALTTYSPTSYFLYRGKTMGFEYELMQRFAESLALDLEIKVAEDIDELTNMLRSGEGDIIAHNLTITPSRQEQMAFTVPLRQVEQRLVQQMPEGWKDMEKEEIEAVLLRDTSQLAGKKIYVRKNSSYYERLKELSENIKGQVKVRKASGTKETGALIAEVAEGLIDYTLADNNIAEITQTLHENVDVQLPVSEQQDIAWAVRTSSPELLEEVNQWLNKIQRTATFNVIYNRYFKNKRKFRERHEYEYSSLARTGKISEFDSLLQQYADSLGWDWRLLASQAFQESRFQIRARSWAGARGLMQVMPRTAQSFGVTNLNDPEQNLQAGIAYLNHLNEFWSHIPDESQKVKFMLASYNAGPYHVEDAQRLAAKLGKDSLVWDNNVEDCILLKAQKEYYRDAVVKYGYCRGLEPYKYVKEITSRYNRYVDLIAELNEDEAV
ncbi:membrane-bound lytic murein transglycosylase F [Catalinimonas alkaloidigena]|uniref:transporter substrate-binding domain-containing protein n=1 Tax=Catalinimonas alkaloidigena TaxID=1075417 RepID=UPI0024049E0A|nr:transporter substrate-binding domain-containing protein [Catalinimonas alkaloidigena]MDF9795453.1 membrane-bound lytic murein transglycosylase F [Catalinimonas alkaloidigena]